MSYGYCSVDELRKFHLDRGFGKADRLGHRQLVKKLETADDNIVFSKMVDLPAEPRCRIYDFYVAAFPARLRCPAQPPLAMTCKLLRQEVLPVFYDAICFELVLTHYRPREKSRYKFHASSWAFLASLHSQHLERISQFDLAICRNFGAAARLNKATKTWCVDIEDNHSYRRPGDVESVRKGFERSLNGSATTGRAKRLTIEVLYAIRRKVEQALLE